MYHLNLGQMGTMFQPRLCPGCDHPRPKTGKSTACIRTSWSTMKTEADLGCITCGILSEGVEKVLRDGQAPLGPGEDTDEDWQLRVDFNMHGPEKSIMVVVVGTDTVLSFFCSEVTPWISQTLPDLPVGYEVPPRTSSPESLEWVLEQIRTCQANHLSCNGLSMGSTLPRRVIDVEARPIRLYESRSEREVPYICLSHVWGDRPFIRTTRDNIASHKRALDVDRLPPTFQDAIRYTQALKVRYLWIDSLCIIQDDAEDWNIEAAKMAKIFQESFLVLSAAKSTNAYGGLFAEFPTSRCKSYTVEVVLPPNNTGTTGSCSSSSSSSTSTNSANAATTTTIEKVHVRRSFTHLNNRLLIPSLSHSADHGGGPLPTLTRGWIFQERFLASRVLHFGPEELIWECLNRCVCQCTSSSSSSPDTSTSTTNPLVPRWYTQMTTRATRPKLYYSPGISSMSPEKTAEITDDLRLVLQDELTTCWHHLVEDYTKLRLSFEKDIFPAISGMALVMCRKINLSKQIMLSGGCDDESGAAGKNDNDNDNDDDWGKVKYLAGLWGHSLPRDLLWRVSDSINDESSTSTTRPEKWRAPSWSWAAVKGPVEFLDQTEGMQVQYELVEEVECAFAGYYAGELLNEPGKNILAVKGRLVPAVVSVKAAGPMSDNMHDNDDDDDEVENREGEFEKKTKTSRRAWEIIELDIFEGHLKNVWVDDVGDDSQWLAKGKEPMVGEKRRVYCLLMGVKKSRALCFLVLGREQTTDEDEDDDDVDASNYYYRVGVAEVFGGPAGPGSWTDRLLGRGSDQTIKIR